MIANRAAAGRQESESTVARLAKTSYPIKACLLAVVYILLARLGLEIHPVSDFATMVWPPSGIALAAILILGFRFWPSIALGAFIANVWVGAPVLVAVGIAAGNTLEALLGAYALRRIPGFRSSLDRLQDMLGLIVFAALGASMVSATIGVSSLLLGGIVAPERFIVTWRAWWLGDAIGALIVAPLILTWRPVRDDSPSRRGLAESVALALWLVLAGLFIFDRTTDAMASLLAPLLIWAAIRFGQRGAARAIFLVSVIAIWATLRGHGPFVRGTVGEGLFALQVFMALTASTFLVLGAVTSERRRADKERRRAEEAIRESEVRYRTLTEAVHQLMWINDAEGHRTYVNPRWEEMVGGGLDLAQGVRWTELAHPDDRDMLLEVRRSGIATGEPYRAEYRLRMKDGGYRWLLARVVPVKDGDGRVTSWFGAAADIHDLKVAEAELRRAKEEAEAASRAKDQFLAMLSHELRTPLTPVLALSSALERDARLPAETRRQIEMVRRNAELEARLIDDLLDLTRIARGKLQLLPEAVEVRDVLDHVTEICGEEAAAKGLTLEREGSIAGTVWADPARLRQVFWNIVKNAIKFTPSGGRILLRAAAAGPERIAIEVSDTGAGIEPSEIARIFKPFEQVVRRSGGLGLGLAISSALVEAHAGTLTAGSGGTGLGATFRVELPALSAGVQAPQVPEAPSLTDRAAGSRRLLLIEDHVDTLTATRELLEELSCEVVVAGGMQEALAAAEARSFDLVVSDLGLPDGSGFELMERLRDRYGLEGIAVTGYGMESDVRRSREAGFVDHLVKPITFQQLAGAIDRFFASRPIR